MAVKKEETAATTAPAATVAATGAAKKKDEVPTPTPTPTPTPAPPPMPTPVPDDDDVTIIYEKVTLTFGGMELHIARLAEKRWRLYAQLNYITVATVDWLYDEIFEGDELAAYAHATARLKELAELKGAHDSVHDRVRLMSEGKA